MNYRKCQNDIRCRYRPGIVLMMTTVLLVILSILGYTLVSRLSAQRHRDQYIIDYQAARYACDSGVKYALVSLADMNAANLISRPNEPDFSDLFALNDEQYKKLLADWQRRNPAEANNSPSDVNTAAHPTSDLIDINDSNGVGDANSLFTAPPSNEQNSVTVRGPYGPAWPDVTEPLEFKIGSATVRIEIEDENAKYPLGWALLDDKDSQRDAKASFETFCEWMKLDSTEIDDLETQLQQVAAIKTFKLDFQPTRATVTVVPGAPVRGRARARRPRMQTVSIPAIAHVADFAQLFHSSLIDLETLARPTFAGSDRHESALKYMGVWASKTVNVNTAPRNVLEAAFTFGGDGAKVADEIIRRRRIQPFKNIDELQKALFRYSTSIKKAEKYITTVSDFFTIRVTATSGVARASAVIAVTKVDKKMQKIAVLSG